MFDAVLRKLEAIEPLIDAVNKDEITALSSFLYERITHPDSYVVFLGETSSGKSSIINGFVGKDILPVKAIPTTAAITEIDVTDASQEESYSVSIANEIRAVAGSVLILIIKFRCQFLPVIKKRQHEFHKEHAASDLAVRPLREKDFLHLSRDRFQLCGKFRV